MAYENFVREIVETYGLVPRLQERLIRIANRRIAELSLNSSQDVYSYVDYLVGRFNISREERLTVSLDSKIEPDSKTTFGELIGAQDPNLLAIQTSPPDSYARISEVVGILRGKLSDVDFAILIQLAHRGMGPLTASPEELTLSKDEIIANLPQIQERIGILARHYERDGRIVLPRKPIVYVQFDPAFYVKFGKRRYNGNPLAFFEANRDVYGDMSRGELSRFDRAFYNTLVREGQIKLAIPEVQSRALPEAEVIRIVSAYQLHGGNLTDASAALGHSKSTVAGYWKKRGLTPQGKPGSDPLPQEDVQTILSAYGIFAGNASEAARRTGFGVVTINKYWGFHGLQAKGVGGNKRLSSQDAEAIIAAHSTYRGNAAETARILGYSVSIITKNWNAVGLQADGRKIGVTRGMKFGPSKRRLPQSTIDQIVDSYEAFNGNSSEAARHLPYSQTTILRYWNSTGLSARGISADKKDLEKSVDTVKVAKTEKIIAAYERFNGNAAAASRDLGYSAPTISKYWVVAGLAPQGRVTGNKLPQKEIGRIVAAHAKYSGNMNEAASHLGYSPPTIKKYWSESGLEANLNEGNKLPKTEVRKIVTAHHRYNSHGNASKAGKRLGYDAHIIAKYWKNNGLQVNGKSTRVPKNKVKIIIAAHKRFDGNAREAARHLPFSDTTIKTYWRREGLKPLPIKNQYQ